MMNKKIRPKSIMQKINTQTLEHNLSIPSPYTTHDLVKAVKFWFKKYHLDDDSHYVLTARNQKICFTGISEWHLTFDVKSSKSKIMAIALTYLPEVFESGQYKQIQPLNKDRSNKRAKFILFHLYTKKVRIGNYLVTIRAKAGEYPNGKIVLLPKLTAYTFSINKKAIKDGGNIASLLTNRTHSNEHSTRLSIKLITDSASDVPYDIPYVGIHQDDLATFEILEIEAIPPKTAFDDWLDSWLGR